MAAEEGRRLKEITATLTDAEVDSLGLDLEKLIGWLSDRCYWWMPRSPHLTRFSAALECARVVDDFVVPLNRAARVDPVEPPTSQDEIDRAFHSLESALETNAIDLSEDAFRVHSDIRKLIRWMTANERLWMLEGAHLLRLRKAAEEASLPLEVLDVLVEETPTVGRGRRGRAGRDANPPFKGCYCGGLCSFQPRSS